ncbi:MAG: nucleotide exchange factor GrpE, partial [Pseudomonadota bacterium]
GENFEEFVKGVQMTSQSLKNALEKHGIQEVECIGKPFDPNTQEALSSEGTDEYPEGHVTQVFKAPYLYHDKLLRPGQVVVSRAKTE